MLHVFINGEAVTEKELREILLVAMMDEKIPKDEALNIINGYDRNGVIVCLGQRGWNITFNNSFWRI